MTDDPKNEPDKKPDENAGLINDKSEKKNRYEDEDSDGGERHYTSICCESCLGRRGECCYVETY